MLNKYKWRTLTIVLFIFPILSCCSRDTPEASLNILNQRLLDVKNEIDLHDTNVELLLILFKVYEFILNNSNKTIIYENLLYNQACFYALQEVVEGDRKILENILNNSGKSLLDAGLEDDCIGSYNLTYVFLTYQLNTTDHSVPFFNLYNFLQQTSFFTGVCLWKECNNLYKAFFDPKQNQIFFSKMETMGVFNITLFKMNYDGNSKTQEAIWDNPRMDFFTACVWILAIYISFRFVITFLAYILYEIAPSASDSIDEGMNNSYENSQISEDMTPFSQFNTSKKENFLKKKQEKIEYKNGFFYHMTRVLSLRKSVKILFKTRTKYYNENDLRILGGIRFYLLLLITFNENLQGISKLPHRDSAGVAFYRSFWFFVGKYSSFSFLCYACLDGIYLGYKLMCFVKKNNGEFLIKHLLIFLLKTLAPFILFLLSFLILHLYVKEMGYFFGNLTIFDYFVHSNINSKQCVQNPFQVFIPFYLQYIDQTSENSYPDCFRYVYFLSSELYCYIFFLFLFYVLLKIKSKKLDFAVYILNFVNLLLCYFSYSHSIKNEFYTLNDVYGETHTLKYPHLFFIPYFIGINVGIMWFYYKGLTWNDPVSEDDPYNPFFFNYYFMKFFDKCCNKTKLLLILFSYLIKITICLSFFILLRVYGKDNTLNILIKGNTFIDFLFIYEGKVFVLFFILFTITVLFYSEENSFKKILSSKLFIPINRISFAFFCNFDFIVYIFYSVYNMQIYLNLVNCIFMSLALFIVIVIFSFFSVMLFELPPRIIYKDICLKLTQGKKKKVKLSL